MEKRFQNQDLYTSATYKSNRDGPHEKESVIKKYLEKDMTKGEIKPLGRLKHIDKNMTMRLYNKRIEETKKSNFVANKSVPRGFDSKNQTAGGLPKIAGNSSRLGQQAKDLSKMTEMFQVQPYAQSDQMTSSINSKQQDRMALRPNSKFALPTGATKDLFPKSFLPAGRSFNRIQRPAEGASPSSSLVNEQSFLQTYHTNTKLATPFRHRLQKANLFDNLNSGILNSGSKSNQGFRSGANSRDTSIDKLNGIPQRGLVLYYRPGEIVKNRASQIEKKTVLSIGQMQNQTRQEATFSMNGFGDGSGDPFKSQEVDVSYDLHRSPSRSKVSVGYETYSNMNESQDKPEDFLTPDITDITQFSHHHQNVNEMNSTANNQIKNKIIKKNLANLLPLNSNTLSRLQNNSKAVTRAEAHMQLGINKREVLNTQNQRLRQQQYYSGIQPSQTDRSRSSMLQARSQMRHKTPNAIPAAKMNRPSKQMSLAKINNNTFVFMANRASNPQVKKSPMQKSDHDNDLSQIAPFELQTRNDQERFIESIADQSSQQLDHTISLTDKRTEDAQRRDSIPPLQTNLQKIRAQKVVSQNTVRDTKNYFQNKSKNNLVDILPYANQLVIPNFEDRLRSQQSSYQTQNQKKSHRIDAAEYTTRKDQASSRRQREIIDHRNLVVSNGAAQKSDRQGAGQGMGVRQMSKTMNKLGLPQMESNNPSLKDLGKGKSPKMADTLKQKAHKSHRVRFRTDEANDGLGARDYSNLYDKYKKQEDFNLNGQNMTQISIYKSERSFSHSKKSMSQKSAKSSANQNSKSPKSRTSSKWLVKGSQERNLVDKIRNKSVLSNKDKDQTWLKNQNSKNKNLINIMPSNQPISMKSSSKNLIDNHSSAFNSKSYLKTPSRSGYFADAIRSTASIKGEPKDYISRQALSHNSSISRQQSFRSPDMKSQTSVKFISGPDKASKNLAKKLTLHHAVQAEIGNQHQYVVGAQYFDDNMSRDQKSPLVMARESNSLNLIEEEEIALQVPNTTEPTIMTAEQPRGLSECASIEAINPIDIQNQVIEAAIDPVNLNKELITKGIEMAVQTIDEQDIYSPTKKELALGIDQDWVNSILFKVVVDTSRLPLRKRNEQQKIIEQRLLNPDGEDIFTEIESGYNASLLMNEVADQKNQKEEEPFDQEFLKEIYSKAKQTVQILSEALMLSTENLEQDLENQVDLEMKVASPEPNSQTQALEQKRSVSPDRKSAVMQLSEARNMSSREQSPIKKTSIILLNNIYQKVNISTVIKLLLRCKKLYQAMSEIKKILQNILTQDEVYFVEDGEVQNVLNLYEKTPGLELKDEDDQIIQKCQQGILRLSRRIYVFQKDHRIFKHFKFKGKYHQKTLFKRAKRLCKFLVQMESKNEKFKYPSLDIDGQLQFVSLAPGEDPTRYHNMDPEDANDIDEPCVKSIMQKEKDVLSQNGIKSQSSKKTPKNRTQSSVSGVSSDKKSDGKKLPKKKVKKKKSSPGKTLSPRGTQPKNSKSPSKKALKKKSSSKVKVEHSQIFDEQNQNQTQTDPSMKEPSFESTNNLLNNTFEAKDNVQKRNEITPYFQTDNTEPQIVSKEMEQGEKKQMPKSSENPHRNKGKKQGGPKKYLVDSNDPATNLSGDPLLMASRNTAQDLGQGNLEYNMFDDSRVHQSTMLAADGPVNIQIEHYQSMYTDNKNKVKKQKKYLYESKESKSRSKNRTPIKSQRAYSRHSAESFDKSQMTDMTFPNMKNQNKKKKKRSFQTKPVNGRQCQDTNYLLNLQLSQNIVFPSNMKDPQGLPSIMKKKHLTPINRDTKNAYQIFSPTINLKMNAESVQDSAEQLGNLLRKFQEATPKDQSFVTPKYFSSNTPQYDYMIKQATGVYKQKTKRKDQSDVGY